MMMGDVAFIRSIRGGHQCRATKNVVAAAAAAAGVINHRRRCRRRHHHG